MPDHVAVRTEQVYLADASPDLSGRVCARSARLNLLCRWSHDEQRGSS